MSTLNPKNILIRGLDGPHSYGTIQNLLNELKPENCWFIYDPNHYPNRPKLTLPAGVTLHEIPIYPIIECDYSKLETTILPADEPLLNAMALAEVITLKMADRMWMFPDIATYQRRKWHYLSQVAAWNSFIKEKKIDLYLLHVIPHHPVDYVTYELMRHYGIPCYYLEKLPIADGAYVTTHWEQAGDFIRDRYLELKKQNLSSVTLQSKVYQDCFDKMSSKTETPKYAHIEKFIASQKKLPLMTRLQGKLARVGRVLKRIFSLNFSNFTFEAYYTRKHSVENRTAKLNAYYNSITKPVDYSVKYAYFPIQYQPEGSTTPMCDHYMEQLLSIQILAACVPPDWKVYAKEYRGQAADGRDQYFYDELLKIRNLVFLDKNVPSADLTRSAQIVATGTGTAGWEAAFQEKPTFLFGHPSFQFIPGAHIIRSLEDCQNAVAASLRGEKPNLADIKLFMKAAEETVLPCYNQIIFETESKITREQNVENLTKSFLRAIRKAN